MTADDFHKICQKASGLAVREHGKIGFLKLSVNDANESLIREPEMIYAFAETLTEMKLSHGIEVPTGGKYRFVDQVGDKTMRARHDLVIFADTGPDVLVELKREQPAMKDGDCPAISKDLRKLLLEKASGKAMFHICHASDSGTLPAVVDKYVIAFRNAMARAESETLGGESWFAIYILVLYDRKDEKKAALYRFEAPTLGELRAAMPGLAIEQFKREEISRG